MTVANALGDWEESGKKRYFFRRSSARRLAIPRLPRHV
jgi:hypothetical protein